MHLFEVLSISSSSFGHPRSFVLFLLLCFPSLSLSHPLPPFPLLLFPFCLALPFHFSVGLVCFALSPPRALFAYLFPTFAPPAPFLRRSLPASLFVPSRFARHRAQTHLRARCLCFGAVWLYYHRLALDLSFVDHVDPAILGLSPLCAIGPERRDVRALCRARGLARPCSARFRRVARRARIRASMALDAGSN